MRINTMRIMKRPTFIDMFSGAGLFSGGFVDAGFEPLLAIDLAKDAVATFNRNLAPVATCASVCDISEIPACDVLVAGPPCQGFSTLGRQDPLDVRNSLALEVPRWAKASRANIVVVENVPPFLKSVQWRTMAADLEAQGYSVSTWVLDAADFATPQFRRRAFTIASKLGTFAPPAPSPRRVTAGHILAQPVRDGDGLHTWPTPSKLASARIALIPACGDKRDLMRLAPDLCPPSWQDVGCQATDVWGRIDPCSPANTIRCTFQNPSKGRYLHPTENRTISLREGARLQGVPDHWAFTGRPYTIARQIGNGVPVPLARAIAMRVRDVIANASLCAAD